MLGLGAIAPIVPKIPIEPTAPAVTSTVLSGKINTGGLLAKIENDSTTLRWGVDGPERFRIHSNAAFMEMYEKALWAGNPITNKNK